MRARTEGPAKRHVLQRIIPLPEAARLSSMSIDTIKRRHGGKIVHISPRRRGMRLRDALTLTV
jgi:hypothetical protein